MSEIRRYDTFNDVEFPSTDGPYYMVADADAKVSELEQQVKAARELLLEYRNNTMDGDVHAGCKLERTRDGAEVDCRCNVCRRADAYLEKGELKP